MSFRLAASVVAAALLCGCGTPKPGGAATGPATSPAVTAAPAPPAPGGPLNAPVAQAERPGAIPLDPAQRRELAAALARATAVQRPRLRYALAAADDGKRRLVVYDGEGLPPSGRHPGKRNEYVMFKVLNGRAGEHYDPQQNSIVPPIAAPVQRDNPISR